MVYADLAELTIRWPEAPQDESTVTRLEDASNWLAASYPIPDELSERLESVLVMLVCAMVRRSMEAKQSNVTQQTHVAGPFTQSYTFKPAEGVFFLTAQEKDLLETALGLNRRFTQRSATGW